MGRLSLEKILKQIGSIALTGCVVMACAKLAKLIKDGPTIVVGQCSLKIELLRGI